MSAGIDTSGLGGQGWRRRDQESSGAVAAGARRWALRAGLVLAAGAATFSVTAGPASADSGLSGTLHHVSDTVKKVTGSHESSHSSGSKSSHASPASKSSHSSSSFSASSHRSSSVSSTRVSVRRAVVKPVVRHVVRPVVHVESAHDKQVKRQAVERAEHRAEKRAEERAEQAAKKKQAARVAHAVASLQRSVLHTSTTTLVKRAETTRPEAAGHVDLGLALPRVQLGVDLGVLRVGVDVGSSGVAVGVDGPAVSLALPTAPAVPSGPSTTASLDLDPPLAPPAAHAEGTSRTRPSSESSAPLLAPRSALTRSTTTALGRGSAPGSGADGPVVAPPDGALPVLPTIGSSGVDGLGLAPSGAASAGTAGATVLGLTDPAGLGELQALHARPANDRSDRAWRLVRQPGFAPD